jgi:hypothetical protein
MNTKSPANTRSGILASLPRVLAMTSIGLTLSMGCMLHAQYSGLPPVVPVPILLKPDLKVSSIVLGSPTVLRGGSVSYPIRLVIENSGAVRAGRFLLSPYLWRVGGGDIPDFLPFSDSSASYGRWVDSLGARTSLTISSAVVVPASSRGRLCEVDVVVDATGAVKESNESNNYSSRIRINVPR